MDMEESAQLDPELTRVPLRSQTNFLGNLAVSSQGKTVRRKASFLRNSSDTSPSSHASIYEAEHFSVSDEDLQTEETWPLAIVPEVYQNCLKRKEKSRGPGSSITPIIYGHGTPLGTIIERKSTSTMRTTATSNASSNIDSVLPTPKCMDSPDGIEPTVPLRPKMYFSANDYNVHKPWRAQHNDKFIITDITDRPPCVTVREVYAQPRMPVRPPLIRPSTPPGLPSWTAMQDAFGIMSQTRRRGEVTRRKPRDERWRRLKRLFGMRLKGNSEPATIVENSEGPNWWTSLGRSSSTFVPRQRFRPLCSGYGNGPLELYPSLREVINRDGAGKEDSAIQSSMQNAPLFHHSILPGTIAYPELAEAPDHSSTELWRETQGFENQRRMFTPHFVDRDENEQPIRAEAQIQEAGTIMKTGSKPCPHRYDSFAARNQRSPGIFRDNSTRISCHINTNQLRQTVSPIVTDCPLEEDGGNETTTIVEPLMSGAFTSPSPHICWKCFVANVVKRIDLLWERSAKWCCWVCCGCDMDEKCDVVELEDVHEEVERYEAPRPRPSSVIPESRI